MSHSLSLLCATDRWNSALIRGEHCGCSLTLSALPSSQGIITKSQRFRGGGPPRRTFGHGEKNQSALDRKSRKYQGGKA